jgi:hypothetical protein
MSLNILLLIALVIIIQHIDKNDIYVLFIVLLLLPSPMNAYFFNCDHPIFIKLIIICTIIHGLIYHSKG